MTVNRKSYSLFLTSATLILFLLFILSIASASNEQDTSSAAVNAYLANPESNTVSVIDTATNAVIATVPVGSYPYGVAVTPDGAKVYVTNRFSNSVSVIDTKENNVIATVEVGSYPVGVAVSSDETRVYVTNSNSNTVSIIDTKSNNVISTVDVGNYPVGVAVSSDGAKVYVTNCNSNTVSVIDISTNKVTATVPVGNRPFGIAVNPQGTKVYIANCQSNFVSVIDTAKNTVSSTVYLLSSWTNIWNFQLYYHFGIAVNPQGTEAYVTSAGSNTVSVIDTSTNKVTATINVGNNPKGVAVNSQGTKVYVTNAGNNTVSVIDTATNTITTSLQIGYSPEAFGQFVGPSPTQSVFAPVANFSSDVILGNVPLSVQFTDLSQNAASINWDFGDGDTSTDKNPVHVYSKEGIYTVKLTVTNAMGTNSKLATITVLNPSIPPVSNFTSNVTVGSAPLPVQFTDLSQNTASWNWDFGDGETSTDRNPVHVYSKAGFYTVVLTANNLKGSNTTTKASYIQVKPPQKPVANLRINVTRGSPPLSVQFTDLSQNAVSRSWDFGDGNTSTDQNPVHVYYEEGIYNVKLIVINSEGTDWKLVEITVKNQSVPPVADFNTNVTAGSAPLKVLFIDFSRRAVSVHWDFGDGNNSSSHYPIHVYYKEGNYTVNLTATNAYGVSSKTATIRVFNTTVSEGNDNADQAVTLTPEDHSNANQVVTSTAEDTNKANQEIPPEPIPTQPVNNNQPQNPKNGTNLTNNSILSQYGMAGRIGVSVLMGIIFAALLPPLLLTSNKKSKKK